MKTFSALLAICAGNSPVTGEFPSQRPVTRSFDVFFDLPQNKLLSKQWWGWWFETPRRPVWRHFNVLKWLRIYHCIQIALIEWKNDRSSYPKRGLYCVTAVWSFGPPDMEMCHLNAVSTLRWKPATHSFISADGEPLATFLLMEQNYPRLSVGGMLTTFALSSIWYHEVTYKKITAFNLSKYKDIRTYILLCWIMKSHTLPSIALWPHRTLPLH